MAFSAYLAYVETVLDEVRVGDFAPQEIVTLLNETLAGALRAAQATPVPAS